jgi:hypothetical protein
LTERMMCVSPHIERARLMSMVCIFERKLTDKKRHAGMSRPESIHRGSTSSETRAERQPSAAAEN